MVNTVIPFIGEDNRYHFIYKITNKVNGKYYKGVHSTFNLNDGYLGSGVALNEAKEKYGKENFDIEYIKFFKDRDSALLGEFEYITDDDIKSSNCYNLVHGGREFALGKCVAYDENGIIYFIDNKDERFINGKLKSIIYNKVCI